MENASLITDCTFSPPRALEMAGSFLLGGARKKRWPVRCKTVKSCGRSRASRKAQPRSAALALRLAVLSNRPPRRNRLHTTTSKPTAAIPHALVFSTIAIAALVTASIAASVATAALATAASPPLSKPVLLPRPPPPSPPPSPHPPSPSPRSPSPCSPLPRPRRDLTRHHRLTRRRRHHSPPVPSPPPYRRRPRHHPRSLATAALVTAAIVTAAARALAGLCRARARVPRGVPRVCRVGLCRARLSACAARGCASLGDLSQ